MRPLVCNYFLTFRCNDTCEFCRIWQDKCFQPGDEATLESIKHNLRGLKELGVPVLNVTGGEPLLREDLTEILREAKRLGFFIILTSNGIEYPAKAQSITPFVDHLLFSLDWPTAEEHDRIRGAGCYDSVIESIGIAKKLGKAAFINFTVTRDSVTVLPEMYDLALKLGVLLWINPVYNWPGLEGFEKASVGYISRYFGLKNSSLNLASLSTINAKGNRTRHPLCAAGSATITVLPDNTLVSPCLYLQKAAVKINNDLVKVLRGREVRLSVPFHGREKACEGCMAWEYLNPSFLRKFDKSFFLAAYSLWKLFWKEIRLKKGA